jgi:hypothetical protein
MSLLWPESHSVFAQRTSSEGRGAATSVRITASFISQLQPRTWINLVWDITQKITAPVSFWYNTAHILRFAYNAHLSVSYYCQDKQRLLHQTELMTGLCIGNAVRLLCGMN